MVMAFLAMLTIVTPGVSAQADVAQCGSNRMCFWYNQGFGGTFFSLTASDQHLGNHCESSGTDDSGIRDRALWTTPGHAGAPRFPVY
jgi:hypothetical protein